MQRNTKAEKHATSNVGSLIKLSSVIRLPVASKDHNYVTRIAFMNYT